MMYKAAVVFLTNIKDLIGYEIYEIFNLLDLFDWPVADMQQENQ